MRSANSVFVVDRDQRPSTVPSRAYAIQIDDVPLPRSSTTLGSFRPIRTSTSRRRVGSIAYHPDDGIGARGSNSLNSCSGASVSAVVQSLACHGLIEQRAAPGSSLNDKEPLVAAWTRSALAASERVRRGVGRGTHRTRTGYRALHRSSCVIQRDRTRTQSSRRVRHKTCSQRGCQPCVAEPGCDRWSTPLPRCRCHRWCS